MGVKRRSVRKAYEITDADITFVSLVSKAANGRKFLITKSEDGTAAFQTYGRILKADPETHYVTGIVYEPMVEDTQGNYMTEAEITKAAYGYAKNGMKADLQHDFTPMEGASVVETYITKSDETINGQAVKKGTWIMTMEVTDPDVFAAVEKGDITGFSMGGKGLYSTEDVNLNSPEEGGAEDGGILKGAAKWVAKKLYGTVEKGAVKDSYFDRITNEAFWAAFYALQDVLFRWDYYNDRRVYVQSPEQIQEALADFNEIVTDILAQPAKEDVAKSVDGIMKAGKAMSQENRKTLAGIHESLGVFLQKFEEEEEIDMTKEDVEKIVKSAITECLSAQPAAANGGNIGAGAAGAADTEQQAQPGQVSKGAGAGEPQQEKPITKAEVQEMIDAAIRKATGEEDPEPPAEDNAALEQAVAGAVAKAMEPFLAQAGLPTNLNSAGVQKQAEEQHYMHGFI